MSISHKVAAEELQKETRNLRESKGLDVLLVIVSGSHNSSRWGFILLSESLGLFVCRLVDASTGFIGVSKCFICLLKL